MRPGAPASSGGRRVWARKPVSRKSPRPRAISAQGQFPVARSTIARIRPTTPSASITEEGATPKSCRCETCASTGAGPVSVGGTSWTTVSPRTDGGPALRAELAVPGQRRPAGRAPWPTHSRSSGNLSAPPSPSPVRCRGQTAAPSAPAPVAPPRRARAAGRRAPGSPRPRSCPCDGRTRAPSDAPSARSRSSASSSARRSSAPGSSRRSSAGSGSRRKGQRDEDRAGDGQHRTDRERQRGHALASARSSR